MSDVVDARTGSWPITLDESKRFSILLSKSVLDNYPELSALFQINRPCPHVFIEEFLDASFCARLLDQFPETKSDVMKAFLSNGKRGGKSKYENVRALGDSYVLLDDLLKSKYFIDLLSAITSIPNLIYDRTYYGGGTHESLNGEVLPSHIDYNFHPETGWYRRLNLLIYLNHDWQSNWGGELDLHSDPLHPEKDEVTSCPVLFNNCVILETSSISWHGFSLIELPEDKIATPRKSIAVYYYTKEPPDNDTRLNRSTVYVDEPLPKRIRAGYRYTSRDLFKLRELLQIRRWHGRELLDETINRALDYLTWQKPNYELNHHDEMQLQTIMRTIDALLDRLERDHLRLRNLGKDVESNEAPWLRSTGENRRIDELEVLLIERTQDAERLRKELAEVRNSTIWKSTGPVRYLLESLRGSR